MGRQFEIPDLYRFLGRAHEIDEDRQQGKAAHVHSLRKDIQNSLSFRKRQQDLQKLSIGKQEFFDIVRMIVCFPARRDLVYTLCAKGPRTLLCRQGSD